MTNGTLDIFGTYRYSYRLCNPIALESSILYIWQSSLCEWSIRIINSAQLHKNICPLLLRAWVFLVGPLYVPVLCSVQKIIIYLWSQWCRWRRSLFHRCSEDHCPCSQPSSHLILPYLKRPMEHDTGTDIDTNTRNQPHSSPGLPFHIWGACRGFQCVEKKDFSAG